MRKIFLISALSFCFLSSGNVWASCEAQEQISPMDRVLFNKDLAFEICGYLNLRDVASLFQACRGTGWYFDEGSEKLGALLLKKYSSLFKAVVESGAQDYRETGKSYIFLAYKVVGAQSVTHNRKLQLLENISNLFIAGIPYGLQEGVQKSVCQFLGGTKIPPEQRAMADFHQGLAVYGGVRRDRVEPASRIFRGLMNNTALPLDLRMKAQYSLAHVTFYRPRDLGDLLSGADPFLSRARTLFTEIIQGPKEIPELVRRRSRHQLAALFLRTQESPRQTDDIDEVETVLEAVFLDLTAPPRLRAEAGLKTASYFLADFFHNRREEAAGYFQSIVQGEVFPLDLRLDAMWELGECYRYGIGGVGMDWIVADMWFRRFIREGRHIKNRLKIEEAESCLDEMARIQAAYESEGIEFDGYPASERDEPEFDDLVRGVKRGRPPADHGDDGDDRGDDGDDDWQRGKRHRVEPLPPLPDIDGFDDDGDYEMI